jgi:site-specific DNA-methyltransferase (cytosine-N4-specific)
MVKPYYQDDLVTLHLGTAASVGPLLNPGSVRTIVTSPPYFGLRDYGHDDQIGAEASVQEYVDNLVATFAALRPALADDGTLWLNLGDSYASGSRTSYAFDPKLRERAHLRPKSDMGAKNLLGVPWRVAFALQADGWILRSDIIWAKPNPMPESVTDRPTKAHEYLFLLAKSPKYYYDAAAIREEDSGLPSGNGFVRPERLTMNGRGQDKQWQPGGGRNKRDVWTVAPSPFAGAHFAVYPPDLIRPCILAGSCVGDTVLDPFSGSGTTGMVATQEGRRYIGIDVNSDYLDLSLRTRFAEPVLDMTGGVA